MILLLTWLRDPSPSSAVLVLQSSVPPKSKLLDQVCGRISGLHASDVAFLEPSTYSTVVIGYCGTVVRTTCETGQS